MKTAAIFGVVGGIFGVIANFWIGDFKTAVWALAATCWALNALVAE